MRIAIVTDTFPRWSERFIARELLELKRRGIAFEIFALKRGKLPFSADEDWFPLLEYLNILPKVPSPRTGIAALTATPGLANKSARRRLALVFKHLGLPGVLRASRFHVLSQWLRAGNFTHLHAHFANWPSTLAWLSAEELGLPLTVSVHARDLFLEAQLLIEKVRYAQRVLVCHTRAEAHLKGLLPTELKKKVVLMHHGLELEAFNSDAAMRRDRFSQRDPARLITAGRFVPKKGFREMLRVLAPLSEQLPFELTIYGEGPERNKLQQEIASQGLQAQVRLVPPVSLPELRLSIRASDLFLAPFRPDRKGDSDGIPNVVLEAFALGTAVAGLSHPAFGEVLNAQTGFIAENEQTLVNTVIPQALGDMEERKSRIAQARRLIEERFDLRKNIEPLLEVLH